MTVRIAGIFVFTLVLHLFAYAQHGDAGPGYYTFDYHGDIWTGEIASFDQGAGTLTLTYEHKGKVETFTGVLKPPLQIIDKDGNRAAAQVRVKVGDRITAYYIREGLKYSVKEGGKYHNEVAAANLIFQIMLLPPKKH
ncbi:MAG: hypothetical protein WB562_05230 [Candidatus Sulfotelmatobacter sp.]